MALKLLMKKNQILIIIKKKNCFLSGILFFWFLYNLVPFTVNLNIIPTWKLYFWRLGFFVSFYQRLFKKKKKNDGERLFFDIIKLTGVINL